jgi:hypothetical protein
MMINFHASSFTWESRPHEPDPFYKYVGGFVGEDGYVYHVRFNLQSACRIREPGASGGLELFLGSPCRSEYTIADSNLFQIPSGEWRMPFSREGSYTIASRPSWEQEPSRMRPHAEARAGHRIVIRCFDGGEELTTRQEIVDASLGDDLLNGVCTWRDEARGLEVTVEFPVNLINVNTDPPQFQVCTGPILLPDLGTWDGADLRRIFVADVALTRFDRVEFILRREVEAADSEKDWLDRPRGRDRQELIDPANAPEGYPPGRPKPTVFNEVWDLESTNLLLRAENSYSIRRS